MQTPDNQCQVWQERLRDCLGSYNKSNLDLGLFTRERIIQAIGRAKALDIDPAARWPVSNGTHVYKIAERLLEHFHPFQR